MSDASPAKILIIDDTPTNIDILIKILAPKKYHISVANSGEKALRILLKRHPDLILLDIKMPGMNGIETCRCIKQDPRLKAIPILFISALADKKMLIEALDVGGVDYIEKPFHDAEILLRVNAQLKLSLYQKEILGMLADKAYQTEYLHSILNNIKDGIFTCNSKAEILYINPAIERIFDYDRKLLIGANIQQLFGDTFADELNAYFRTLVDQSSHAINRGAREVQGRRQDGSLFHIDFTLLDIYAKQQMYIGIIHDIGLQKQIESEIRRVSGIDALTNLTNYRQFKINLHNEFSRAKRNCGVISLLLLDIDGFKKYNEKHGFQAGDRCLQQIARILTHIATRPADIAARYHPATFALLLPNTDIEGINILANRISNEIKALAIPYPSSDIATQITISIGISSLLIDNDNLEEKLLESTQVALKTAKSSGQNRIIINAES